MSSPRRQNSFHAEGPGAARDGERGPLAPPALLSLAAPANYGAHNHDKQQQEAPNSDEVRRSRRASRVPGITRSLSLHNKLFVLTVYMAALFAGMAVFSVLLMWLESGEQLREIARFQKLVARLRASNATGNSTIEALRPYLPIDPDVDTSRDFFGDEARRTIRSWSYFSEAFYYSFTAVTTIGYGDMAPKTRGGKLCSILMIVSMLPVAIAAYTRLANYCSELLMKRMLSQQAEFRAVLNKYDADGNGTIDKKELKDALNDLGIEVSVFCPALVCCCLLRARQPTNESQPLDDPCRSQDIDDHDVEDFVKTFDVDGNHVLDVDEFANLATKLKVPVGKIARSYLHLRFSLIIVGGYLLIFSALVMHELDLSAMDAAYFSVVTLATVGFGDISPRRKVWLVLPIFLGLGIVAILVNAVADHISIGEDDDESDAAAPAAIHSKAIKRTHSF